MDITFIFNSEGRHGLQEKSLTVYSNDKKNSTACAEFPGACADPVVCESTRCGASFRTERNGFRTGSVSAQ